QTTDNRQQTSKNIKPPDLSTKKNLLKLKIRKLIPRGILAVYTKRVEIFRRIRTAKYELNHSFIQRKSENICPICNREIKKFRFVSVCPYCLATDKQRVFIHYLKNHMELLKKNGKNILITPWEQDKKFFTDMQISYLISEYPENGKDLSLDLTNISLEDKSVDLIWASHILEHIPNDKKAINELARVIHPKGKVFIAIPETDNLEITYEDKSIVNPKDRQKAYGSEEHCRLYGQDFTKLLEKYFTVKVINISEYEKKHNISYGQRGEGIQSINLYICNTE
ncbi:MAG: class I SAM-dependent methyltransferase, partial [Clostridiales Family XIII bacterium]|nr:class I SAM-dependent methyltransferase [Clostridiales Family XIII bacterium]